ALLGRHLLAPLHQPGAGAALHDLVIEGEERSGARHGVRVGFAAVRLLLVVNPAASSVTPHVRTEVERTLRTAHVVEVAETTHRGHATTLARDAVSAGYEVVVVLA